MSDAERLQQVAEELRRARIILSRYDEGSDADGAVEALRCILRRMEKAIR